jgi:hypothetical protein
MTYKLTLPEGKESNTFDIIIKVGENGNNDAYIPADPDNTSYQEYLEWVADGNTPLPADSE